MRRLGGLPPSRSWMGVISRQKLAQLDHAALAVREYVVVPEPDHAIALISKKRCAFGVRLLTMLTAVDFNDHAVAVAGEVCEIMPEGHLEPEPRLWKALLQGMLHPTFGFGRIAT